MSDFERIASLAFGELVEYESTRDWINRLPKPYFRENGKVRYSGYLRELHLFIKWFEERTGEKMDPDKLLKLRLEQMRSDETKTRRRMEDLLQEYHKSALSERKVSSGSRLGEPISDAMKISAVNSISSFFANNYAQMSKIKVPRRIKRATRDYWYTIDDIREMCEVAAPWEKAYILTHLSIALRISDILNLMWSDLWPYISDAKEGEVIGPLNNFTEKCGIEARSFLTPDAVKALKRLRAYQAERGRLGRYVFRNAEDQPLNINHVNRRLQILFKRAGRNSRGLSIKSHGLRKMLFNEMKNIGAPLDVRKIIVGKVVSEDIMAYINDDELQKWFLAALPRIAIEEPRPETAIELKKEIEELRERFGAAIEELQRTVRNLSKQLEMMDKPTKTVES